MILCERGIRTFETATRNTLDLSAIPVLRERTHLPVIVDPSHAAGRARRWCRRWRAAPRRSAPTGSWSRSTPTRRRRCRDGPQALTFPQFADLMADLLA